MEIKEPKEETVTLPFSILLEEILGSRDRVSINPITASILAVKDKEERRCHIQFTDLDTDEELERPVLWNLREWRSCYQRHLQIKAKAEAERKEACILKENTDLLARKMAKDTGLDKEFFRGLAFKIAKKKSDKAAALFNVKLDKP